MANHTDEIVALLSAEAARDRTHCLHVLLDTARSERILPAITESGCACRSLYPADIPKALADAAPRLVKLPIGAPFLRRLVGEGWGDSWGVYFVSSAPLKELRAHFRKFIKARTEDGETLMFRFYDPRVLRLYLPTCNAGELASFMRMAGSFFLEDDDPKTLLRYHTDNGTLAVERVVAAQMPLV